MTHRLYYTDGLLAAFDATVLRCEPEGAQFAVTLDRTAFYPTSGGQPFDTGRIGGAAVVDVRDQEDDIVHVVDRPIAAQATVHGEIDWARRFDHMQQHTGQHMLSAAFDRRAMARTLSFHLGAESATIDLSRDVTPAEIADVECEVNRVVWEDRPVAIRFASEDEAARLPLRKESARTGTLRLVEVADYDLSACGGTHVPRTGMIGIIAVAAWERFKGGSRITFVCGGRALATFDRQRDIVLGVGRSLSVAAGEIAATVERLRGEARDLGKAVRHLQEEVAGHRGAALRAAAASLGEYRVVLHEEPAWDAGALKVLTQAIVAAPGHVAIVMGGGRPVPVVVARSADVRFDAAAWLKRAVESLGGRGGGRAELAQGGLTADAAAVAAFARQSL